MCKIVTEIYTKVKFKYTPNLIVSAPNLTKISTGGALVFSLPTTLPIRSTSRPIRDPSSNRPTVAVLYVGARGHRPQILPSPQFLIGSIVISLSRCCPPPNDEGPGPQIFFPRTATVGQPLDPPHTCMSHVICRRPRSVSAIHVHWTLSRPICLLHVRVYPISTLNSACYPA